MELLLNMQTLSRNLYFYSDRSIIQIEEIPFKIQLSQLAFLNASFFFSFIGDSILSEMERNMSLLS